MGQLFFIGLYTDYLLPDGNLSFLQHLSLLGPCLDGNMGFWLPPSPWWLRVKSSCLQNVGELVDIFPGPVLGPPRGYLAPRDVRAVIEMSAEDGQSWPSRGPGWGLCVWTI